MVISFTIDARGMTELGNSFGKLAQRLPMELDRKVVKRSIEAFRRSASAKAPRDALDLKRAVSKIRITPHITKDRVVREIDFGKLPRSVDYWRYQEFGFTPHWVSARELKKTSRKMKNVTGGAFVSKSKPFIRPAFDAIIPKVNNFVEDFAAGIRI